MKIAGTPSPTVACVCLSLIWGGRCTENVACYDRGAYRTIFHPEVSPVNELNPLTTGNPFLGTKLLGFSIGRGSGALKGLRPLPRTGLEKS